MGTLDGNRPPPQESKISRVPKPKRIELDLFLAVSLIYVNLMHSTVISITGNHLLSLLPDVVSNGFYLFLLCNFCIVLTFSVLFQVCW